MSRKQYGTIPMGLTVLALGLFTTGCLTMETASERNYRLRQNQRMQMQVSQLATERGQQARTLASLDAELQMLLEERARLAAAMEAVQQQNSNLAAEINEIKQRLSLAERQLSTMNSEYKRRLESLQNTITKQERARQTEIDDVIKTVSEQISDTANRLQSEQRQLIKSMSAGGNAQGEYVVSRGDTLSAIAQAFGVTVDSIKRANNLGSDLIREGQTLVIPAQ